MTGKSLSIDNDVFKLITLTLLFALAVPSLALISICLHTIRTSERFKRKNSTLFLVEILLIQLIQCVIGMPAYGLEISGVWNEKFRITIVDIFQYVYNFCFYGTFLSAILISAERFVVVSWNIFYKNHVTKNRIIGLLIAKNIYILILCAMPLMDFEPHAKPKDELLNQSSNYNEEKIWLTLMLVCNGIIPYMYILYCYYRVVKKIKFTESHTMITNIIIDITENDEEEEEVVRIAMTKKLCTVSLILSILYGIVLLPKVVYSILEKFYGYDESMAHEYTSFVITYISFFTTIFTPSLYLHFLNYFESSSDSGTFNRIL